MEKQIILTRGEYEFISQHIANNMTGLPDFSLRMLALELKSAKVVDNNEFPKEVVRLNSDVKIRIAGEKNEIAVKLVMPKEADIKKNRISVFAPLGSAVIGYKEGDTVYWQVPGGTKAFEILEVKNQ